MTTPNGAAGVTIPDGLSALLFPTSGPGQTKAMALTGRYGLTRELVEAGLKNDYVLENPSVQIPLASIYEEFNLPAGTPLALAIMTVLARQLLGLPAKLWGSITDVLADIQPWVENIPGLGDLIELLTGIPDGDENDLASWVQRLLKVDSALNAANLFGWIGQIDLGSIGQFSPNLLSEGDFLDSIVINPNSGYSVEDGAAVVTANGTDRPLKSEVIRVSPNQQIWAGASAAYESATGAAGSVLVELILCVEAPLEESGWAPVSSMVMGSLTPSGTAPDWAVLSNELTKYTVPASGVEGVALQLHVTPDALSGKVKYKKAFIKKTQKLPIPFVDQLPTTLSDAAARVQAIIDRIINAFQNLGEFVDGDHDVEDVLGAIFGIFDTGLGARTKAAAIEARVRQLESEANSIVLDFAGASSTSLSGWTVSSSGGGAGSMGLDGKGNLVWKASGAGNRTQIGRYDGGALSVDNGRLEWILSSSPQSYIFDDAFTYVLFRMKDSSNYVRVRSGFDEIRLQAVVAGAVTNIGLAWSGYPKAGDQFALDFGEAAGANKRHFVLTRNGTPIIDVTDTGAVSQVGPDFHKIGAGMETGNRLVFFQNIPAGLGVLTASEVL